MDWAIILTIILTVGFGIATIILTVKVIKKKKPVWAYSTRHIIGRDAEAPRELKYIFGTREVSEVYKTTIIFFNMGNDKFCGDLLPAGNSDLNEAIVVQLKGAEILRPPIVSNRSKGAVNFSVEQVKNCADSIQLHIPILNHNEGAIVEVWHTKYDGIDIPNAEITQLKKFIRQRPEGFYGNIAVPFALLAFLVGLLLSELFQGKALNDYLPLLVPVVIVAGLSALGLQRQLRYRTFPNWSRTEEKTQKEQ